MIMYVRTNENGLMIFNNKIPENLGRKVLMSDNIADYGTVDVSHWVCKSHMHKSDAIANTSTKMLRHMLNV